MELIIKTGNVFPKYLYLIFIIIVPIISFINKKDKDLFCEQLLIIIFAIAFALSISSISTFGFWSARIRFSMGTTIGFLYLHLISKTELSDLKSNINSLLIIVFIYYSMVTVFNYISIMNNTIQVNKKDNEVAIEICNYIKKYEEENNITVTKICLVQGKGKSKAYYKDLKYKNSVL